MTSRGLGRAEREAKRENESLCSMRAEYGQTPWERQTERKREERRLGLKRERRKDEKKKLFSIQQSLEVYIPPSLSLSLVSSALVSRVVFLFKNLASADLSCLWVD